MVGSQQTAKAGSCCTLCPAGCELHAAPSGPGSWRSEVPLKDSRGLCARGSSLGELLGHRARILNPRHRRDGQTLQRDMAAACRGICDAAAGKDILFFLSANVPCEQIVAAEAWCRAWSAAKLCLVMDPADRELLLGTEASGAEHLSEEALASCDGFVIIGDAFAANPRCSRAVFERREAVRRMPIVVIDAAAGTAAKFASHNVQIRPGMELGALVAVAAAAGAKLKGYTAADLPAAAAAGQAIARCERLGVLVSAEHGRSNAWRQIGYVAGQLAKARGGGTACQTDGGNILAALRLAQRLETVPLAEALGDQDGAWVAVGCDVLGMLGWRDKKVLAAAAALPNATTEAAEFVLPTALPAEQGGTYLLDGGRLVEVEPMLAPPAGVPQPADVIAELAAAAGIAPPQIPSGAGALERLDVEAPAAPEAPPAPDAPALLFGRQAQHDGSGMLTAHASWQAAAQPVMELRVSPEDAAELGLRNLAVVQVSAGQNAAQARVRICQELPAGAVVLPQGFAEARTLAPLQVDAAKGAIAAAPVTVTIEA